MITSEGLEKLGFDPKVDFVLQNDGQGVYIKEWNSASPQPTEAEIETANAEWEAEWSAAQYQRDRKELYPTFEDVIVSLAEKTEGYSDDMWKQIKAKRKEVREGNPKPAGRQVADTEFQTRRQSAIDKLVALGLTAEEIEAIIL